jgi:hypothetical protein
LGFLGGGASSADGDCGDCVDCGGTRLRLPVPSLSFNGVRSGELWLCDSSESSWSTTGTASGSACSSSGAGSESESTTRSSDNGCFLAGFLAGFLVAWGFFLVRGDDLEAGFLAEDLVDCFGGMAARAMKRAVHKAPRAGTVGCC